MDKELHTCYKSNLPCSSIWGCHFLTTPLPPGTMTDHDKATLFSKVYREAKQKRILECPFYNSLSIDKRLDLSGSKTN